MKEKNVFDIKAKTWDENPSRMALVESIWQAIRGIIDFNFVARALDYGCGTGLLGYKAIESVDAMTFCDTSEGMLEQVRQKKEYYGVDNATTLKADFTKDALPKKTFDLIMSMLVLHHVHDLDRIIARFNDMLNPGGYFCWIDLESEDGSFHGDNGGVAHFGFNREETENLLVQNGFEVTYYNNHFYMERSHEDGNKKYPVFLLIGKKN